MTIDLLTTIEAIDADKTIIRGADNQLPVAKDLILQSLRVALQSDVNTGFKEKNERYLLIRRVDQADKIELSEGETKLILERAGKFLMQAELVGKLAELLQPKSAAT